MIFINLIRFMRLCRSFATLSWIRISFLNNFFLSSRSLLHSFLFRHSNFNLSNLGLIIWTLWSCHFLNIFLLDIMDSLLLWGGLKGRYSLGWFIVGNACDTIFLVVSYDFFEAIPNKNEWLINIYRLLLLWGSWWNFLFLILGCFTNVA